MHKYFFYLLFALLHMISYLYVLSITNINIALQIHLITAFFYIYGILTTLFHNE